MTDAHILLYGGGIDSTALLTMLTQQVSHLKLLHIDYGQKALRGERRAMAHFANKYQLDTYTLSMDMSYSKASIMKGTEIGVTPEDNRLELRNVALLTYAASFAATKWNNSILYIGMHLEPINSSFLDAYDSYLPMLNIVLGDTTSSSIKIKAPFSQQDRKDILDSAILRDSDIITQSYTCYEETECGMCVHCKQKQAMLAEMWK